MQPFDIPVIHKSYEFYRTLHGLQKNIPKMERYTLWIRCEETNLRILESFLKVGYVSQERRADELTRISSQVDMLRVFLRLAHDVEAINQKQYIKLQEGVDEIGRMLGGWLKSLKQR